MAIEQWGQSPEILGIQLGPELLPLDRPLNQDRVDEHQAIL